MILNSYFFICLSLLLTCLQKNEHKIKPNSLGLENSVFAVIKFSYNSVGETPIEGGICGTAFLINDSTVITANHVLNNKIYMPNPGYKYVQYWLLKRGSKLIIELAPSDILSFTNIETAIIKLHTKLKSDFDLTEQIIIKSAPVFNYGHIINMPVTNAHWEQKLVIDDYNLEQSKSDKTGYIVDIKEASVKSTDVNFENKICIQPSFIANVGMSGGPLICENKLIGLMSFGLPVDSVIKKEVYAISVNEILQEIKNRK